MLRQGSIIIMKTTLKERVNFEENAMFYWDELDPQGKQKIKNSFIGLLGEQHPTFYRTVPFILGTIAAIEVPRG